MRNWLSKSSISLIIFSKVNFTIFISIKNTYIMNNSGYNAWITGIYDRKVYIKAVNIIDGSITTINI